jgi:hypothetical protein
LFHSFSVTLYLAQWLRAAGLMMSVLLLGVSGDRAGSAEAAPRWFGIAIGTAAVTYRPALGDPLQITAFADDATRTTGRKARFAIPGAPSAALTVTERRGVVTGLEALAETPPAVPLLAVEADPNGVRLGESLARVVAARPAARRSTDALGYVHLRELVDDRRGIVADYRFAAGRLVADAWFSPPGDDVPLLPGANPYAEPAADSPVNAILDVQSSEREGVAWERLYLRAHPCDGTTPWRTAFQALQRADGRVYDVIAVRCPTTGTSRAFYFDVTSFAGAP